MSPWHGPFEICGADTKKYGNTYQVKGMSEGKEMKGTINLKNLKEYVERPEWMKSEEDKRVPVDEFKPIWEEEDRVEVDQDKSNNFIPEEELLKIPNPVERDMGEIFEEGEPSSSNKRPARGWEKKPGDLIDVKFRKKRKNGDFESFWACGTIRKVDPYNKDRVKIEFLDQRDGGWYQKDEEEDGPIEWRKCVNEKGHVRSKELKVMMVEKMSRKKLRRKLDKYGYLEGSDEAETGARNPRILESASRGSLGETLPKTLDPYRSKYEGLTKRQTTKRTTTPPGVHHTDNIKVKVMIRGVPIELEGTVKGVGEVFREWL